MLGGFRPEKTIQAAGVLLKAHSPHRVSRLRLVKLLYIADRENIERTGRPITGDDVYAMDHGPVLSRTYDCIKGGDPAASEWERFIQRSGSQDVELVEDPGVGQLSRREIHKLQEVAERYQHLDDYAIAVITHQFQEWIQNQPEPGSSRLIPPKEILEAVGLGAEADEIMAEAQQYAEARRLLSQVTA